MSREVELSVGKCNSVESVIESNYHVVENVGACEFWDQLLEKVECIAGARVYAKVLVIKVCALRRTAWKFEKVWVLVIKFDDDLR